MSAPTLIFSERNGPGSGSVTHGITTINYASADANSATPGLLTNNPVAAGSNSFEKYNFMEVTAISSNTLTAFSVYFNATPPTDGGGSATTVTMKYATTASYPAAGPTNATSTVAQSLCSGTTAAPGTTFTSPTNTVGAYSGYFVTQLQVAAGAVGGNCGFPASFATCVYTYSALALALFGALAHAFTAALAHPGLIS